MSLEEHHDILHILLLLPAFPDFGDTGGSYARHLIQPLNVILYHIERLHPEAGDDQLGEFRAYTLDQPAAQVFLHADDGGRHGLCPGLGGKLPAVALVHAPFALDNEGCTNGHLEEVADDALQIPVAFNTGLEHGIAVVRVLESDMVNDAVDPFHSENDPETLK